MKFVAEEKEFKVETVFVSEATSVRREIIKLYI